MFSKISPLSFESSLASEGSWSYPELFLSSDDAIYLCKYFRKNLDDYENTRVFKSKAIRGLNKYNYDKGMVDCSIDIESLEVKAKSIIRNFLDSKLSHDLKNHIRYKTKSNKVKLDLRYYAYCNVISPRCLHFDSLRYCVKAFILLDPVLTVDNGPYCVVPFSHFFNRFIFFFNRLRRWLRLRNYSLTDAPLLSICAKKKFFGLPGSLYMSRQDMVHGDLPCKTSASTTDIVKSALVFYYF